MVLLTKKTILFLIFISSCKAQHIKQELNFEIYYKAETRGSFIYMNYKDGAVLLKSNTKDKSIALNNAQINKLDAIISNLKLTDIKNLIAPSNKRFTDGALTASFIIKRENTTYTSSNFDHDNPPKEIQELYLMIKTLTKKKVEK